MKKEITVGQLLSAFITVLVAVIGGWITLNNKITENKVNITNVQALQEKNEGLYIKRLESLEAKVDIQNAGIVQILLKLENKADRK